MLVIPRQEVVQIFLREVTIMRKLYLASGALPLMALLIGGLFSLHTTPVFAETIYACAAKKHGRLRLVSAPGQCRKFETELSWDTGAELGQAVNELVGRVDAIEASLGIINKPPSVEAGVDIAILLSMTANLQGTASDDGLLKPLTYSWEKVSGPGNVNFTNPTSLASDVTFDATGTYELKLTANDGYVSVSDTLKVIVFPDNNPPIVEGKVADGYDRTGTITGNYTLTCAIPLTASAADDGLPQPLSYSWRVIGISARSDALPPIDPSRVSYSFSDPSSSNTTLNVSADFSGTDPQQLPPYIISVNAEVSVTDGYHTVTDIVRYDEDGLYCQAN